MMNKSIPTTRSSMPPLDEYIQEIKELWDTHWLTNMGAKHKLLEELLENYLDAPYVSLFTNGHFALEAAIEAFKLKGEVITSPFTFASTTHAIVRKGLKPVFCDINPKDFTIDANKIESLITENTSAIIPIHVYGYFCDVDAIKTIAKKNNLKVIYDAAHTFGAALNGKSAACFGDAAMYSFHATKVFNTIEGGAVAFRDKSLREKLNNILNFGITGPETVVYAGGNAKMNEFQAAMGICNLRHIAEEIEKRKKAFERYNENLSGIKGILLPVVRENLKSNYSYYPVVFDGYHKDRDYVYTELRNNNIFPRKYFYPLTNSFECYNDKYNDNETPVAKYIADRILALPLYADMQLDEVDAVCKIIKGTR